MWQTWKTFLHLIVTGPNQHRDDLSPIVANFSFNNVFCFGHPDTKRGIFQTQCLQKVFTIFAALLILTPYRKRSRIRQLDEGVKVLVPARHSEGTHAQLFQRECTESMLLEIACDDLSELGLAANTFTSPNLVMPSPQCSFAAK